MDFKIIEEKIIEYENFIDEKLKIDLKDVETSLREKTSKYNDWQEVKQVVEVLKEFKQKDTDMPVRFDIGSGVLANGEISDFDTTYVCIGLGYMLEMDPDEANKYSDIRLKLLKKEIEHFRKLAVNIKVHIKLVLLAINELQSTMLSKK